MDTAVVLDAVGAVEERDRVAAKWLERDRGLSKERTDKVETMLKEVDELRALFDRMPRASAI